MRVAIAVCTAARPKMLRACLDSIISQDPPPDSEIDVLVIDNNKTPDARPVTESVAAAHPYVIRYVHEPEPGIPLARNRAVHESLALGADWIAFIDDDEEAK